MRTLTYTQFSWRLNSSIAFCIVAFSDSQVSFLSNHMINYIPFFELDLAIVLTELTIEILFYCWGNAYFLKFQLRLKNWTRTDSPYMVVIDCVLGNPVRLFSWLHLPFLRYLFSISLTEKNIAKSKFVVTCIPVSWFIVLKSSSSELKQAVYWLMCRS